MKRFRSRPAVPEVGDRTHFAHGLNFYKLFWVFFIACFLGVVLETVFCWVASGHLTNRTGLVYGPFNLVYGFGAVLMTVCLRRFAQKRDLDIFLAGMVLGKFLHQWLVRTVEIDMAMFGRDVEPMSYVFAVLLTILFSFLVNLAAHRRLKKIDMVESLKTVE